MLSRDPTSLQEANNHAVALWKRKNGLLDARIDNGLGVMLDDLVAAFYTLLVLAIALRVAG